MTPEDRPQRAGFTLIEVLVVVAIIALLTAILIPSLTSAREQARKAVCLANQKQLGYATFMYATDHRGILWHYNHWLFTGYPPADPKFLVPESGQLMGVQVVGQGRKGPNYAKDPKIYLCPSDKMERRSLTGTGMPTGTPLTDARGLARFSYSSNTYAMRQAGYAFTMLRDAATLPVDPILEKRDYTPMAAIKRTAETPLLIEEWDYSPMNDGYFVAEKTNSTTDETQDLFSTRHGAPVMRGETRSEFFNRIKRDRRGIATLSFFDGHAAGVPSWRLNAYSPNIEGEARLRHALLAPGFPFIWNP